MAVRTTARCGAVEVNGAEIYHEVRGTGPSVVLVAGATGDAGHFSRVAELLAEEFTVVTYDRRGNSRSPRPPGWTRTSTDEQADDLAALIEALGVKPAAVCGTSGGAIITLNAVLRHESVVRGAILHEPPLASVLRDPEPVMQTIGGVVEGGMASGGPRAALQAFLDLVAGDSLRGLDEVTIERMLGNAEVLFELEFGTFESWRPNDDALSRVAIPVQVMASGRSAPFFTEASEWIAQRLGTTVVPAPGGHAPYFDQPEELVQAIRPFLQGAR